MRVLFAREEQRGEIGSLGDAMRGSPLVEKDRDIVVLQCLSTANLQGLGVRRRGRGGLRGDWRRTAPR